MKNANLTRAGLGRMPGAVNRTTATVKTAIEYAAVKMGGWERLAEWAKETPDNERVFWSIIYPKLLPLQVTGEGGRPIEITSIIEASAAQFDAKIMRIVERMKEEPPP